MISESTPPANNPPANNPLSKELHTDCLAIFAKYWEPGKVKTRLASSIGEKKAARLYETFVAATIARLSAFECQRVVAFSPDNEQTRTAFVNAEIDNWTLTPQTDGNLGHRIAAFFEAQFQAGAQRVVLLGTDSPNVPLVEVQAAFEHLQSTDVVVGPTEDGGYYLIGAANKVPPIFSEIAWSTPQVLPSTLARLDETNTSYTTLDPWYDIDEIYDLHRLIEDLRDEAENEPALEILLAHVLKVIEE